MVLKKISYLILIVALIYSCQQKTNLDRSNTADGEVEELLSQMTLEEKVGQMAQITLDVISVGEDRFQSDEPLNLDSTLVREAILKYHVGSILNTANNRARTREKWFEVINTIQQIATTESRLKVPVIYGIDAIHGTTYTAGATFFPQQIGQAATWNRNLVKRGAEITAYETRASYIPWNFSPVLDVGRDARFPRFWETFGEDPYLASEMGIEMVRGYEGESIGDKYQVASCLKHFLGYSRPNSGKDRTPATISEIELKEIFLPPFKQAIEAGASSVMLNSGIINGVPVHANYDLITGLLKNELAFEGLVVTDWQDIGNLHSRDRIAETPKEAVKLAVNAGIDMAMIPYDYDFCEYLVELVNEGEVSMERIDDAVRRVLKLKKRLRLFERPVGSPEDYPDFGSDTFQKTAYQTALESITLLKNKKNILPLDENVRLFVTGPTSNSMRSLNGGWSYSWQGEKTEEFAGEYQTILEAIQAKSSRVSYQPSVVFDETGNYWEEKVKNIDATVSQARQADYIILCLGENSYTEKPGDLHDLTISQNQIDLTKQLAKTGKPIILVLNEGRPRIIREIEPLVDAIFQTYLPGNYGGEALVSLLFGDENPSGKLPYTYPMYSNTLVTYDHKPSEEQNKMEGVYDYESDFAVQYPFGHGLSYTSFEYSNLSVSKNQFDSSDTLTISINIKNTGNRSGKEAALLFISDQYASITPSVKRMRGFEKISLEPGESSNISFTLSKEDFALVGEDGIWKMESGDFDIQIDSLSTTVRLTDQR